MRLQCHELKPIMVKRPKEGRHDAKTFVWQEGGHEIKARILPMLFDYEKNIGGYALIDKRLMLTECIEDVKPGDGVCVDVLPSLSCDYRVISVQKWSYLRCVLESIPLGQRG